MENNQSIFKFFRINKKYIDIKALIIGGSDERNKKCKKSNFRYQFYTLDGINSPDINFQFYLSESSGEKILYKTKHYSSDSLYEPNSAVAKEWNMKGLNSYEKIVVKTYAAKDLNLPLDTSLLKIDVQGAEIDILKGYKGWEKQYLAVEMECDIDQFYLNSPTIGQKLLFMENKGFSIAHIKKVEKWRSEYLYGNKGKLVSLDILFTRKPKNQKEKVNLAGIFRFYGLYSEYHKILNKKRKISFFQLYFPFRETIGLLIVKIGRFIQRKGDWLVS